MNGKEMEVSNGLNSCKGTISSRFKLLQFGWPGRSCLRPPYGQCTPGHSCHMQVTHVEVTHVRRIFVISSK
jgi:hypothetical protein